jgi:hypothetical protein
MVTKKKTVQANNKLFAAIDKANNKQLTPRKQVANRPVAGTPKVGPNAPQNRLPAGTPKVGPNAPQNQKVTPVKSNVPTQQPIQPSNNLTIGGGLDDEFDLSLEERALAKFEKDQFTDPNDFGAELGLIEKGSQPSTLEEFIEKRKNTQAEELAFKQKEFDLLNKIDQQAFEASEKQGKSTIESVKATTAQSQEGPMSVGNPMIADEFERSVGKQLEIAKERTIMLRESRERTIKQIKQAQADGNSELASSLSKSLANMELEIQQADNQYIQTQATAVQTQLNIQQGFRANLDAFKNIIDSGTTMTPQSIKQLSSQMNIPFELAFDLYNAAQDIRTDRSMSSEEKQIALADIKFDFDRKLRGIETEQAKSVDSYMRLAQSGQYSSQELQTLAIAMNIPNENNPIFQAKLQMDASAARIQLALENGTPVNPNDIYNQITNAVTFNASIGQAGQAFIPNESLEGFNVAFEEGKLKITGGDKEFYQCGAFVNRVWGLPSGGSGGFADSYQDKLDRVASDGFSSSGLTNETFGQLVTPGMAFVMGAGGDAKPYGHVGIVTSVDAATGTFTTAETNIAGDKINESPATEKVRNFREVDGFVTPPNATLVGKPSVNSSSYTEAQTLALQTMDPANLTSENKKTIEAIGLQVSDIFEFHSNPNSPIPPEIKDEITSLLQSSFELEEHPGLNNAVGFGLQKIQFGDQSEKGFISGTAAQGFKAKFDQFRDSMTLENLDKLTGTISDSDIAFLRNATTSLSLSTSEKEFKNELARLRKGYQRILGEGGSSTGGIPQQQVTLSKESTPVLYEFGFTDNDSLIDNN